MAESKTALMKATDLLARQEQSSKSLKQKLLARKYDEDEVDAAIDKLQKYHYLNDEETCTRQFENLYAAGKLSVRQIYMRLVQRGFDSDMVKKLIPADTYEHELNAAVDALVKKFPLQSFENGKDAWKYKNKMRQYLMTRGFSAEIIAAAAEKFYGMDIDDLN